MEKKIVIIGAGPTGLGAGYRLTELGYKNWEIFEANDYIGGLSASFEDEKGFVWDIGGHIVFSNYQYFNDLVKKLLGNNYLEYERKSYIWMENRFIAYPLQNNIKDLPKEILIECLLGLVNSKKKKKRPQNFKEWVFATFGKGLADSFMIPYNKKVWAYSLESMSKEWIANRVSRINVGSLIKNVVYNRSDSSWGPNSKFIYPLKDGIAGLFLPMVPLIKDKLHLAKKLTGVDIERKRLKFNDKTEITYDVLITTMPLDLFVRLAKIRKLYEDVDNLKHNSILSVGIGLDIKSPSNKCWMYFPESNCPFYRVTYLSNYSPLNAPGKNYYSLMCETSYSRYKKVNKNRIIDETVQGLINTKLIGEKDKKHIVSKYILDREYSYPIPTVDRDKALKSINLFLEKNAIYSRGRFGAWKYEIGNMDHSVMQGAEIVNKILKGEPETVNK